jgi:hypothetical protein
MSIVAGSESDPSNKPSTLQNAETYRKVSAVLLLVSAILNCLIVLRTTMTIKNVQPGDRVIVWCALASIPFLLVRVAYIMLIGFDQSSLFDPLSPDIFIQSFMQILMEFICFALYLSAGLMSPRIDPSTHAGGGSELLPDKTGQYNNNGYGASDPIRRGQQSGVVGGSRV